MSTRTAVGAADPPPFGVLIELSAVLVQYRELTVQTARVLRNAQAKFLVSGADSLPLRELLAMINEDELPEPPIPVR